MVRHEKSKFFRLQLERALGLARTEECASWLQSTHAAAIRYNGMLTSWLCGDK